MSHLQVINLHKNFGDHEVLGGVNLEVCAGEIVVLLGPSGMGKTTLLNCIAGILPCDSGDVKNVFERIGYVFQEDRLLPWRTVKENIQVVDGPYTNEAIDQLIADVGLRGFDHAKPSSLSGGMRQRTAIARAFAYGADLLLMDEPFKSLDYTLRLAMIQMLSGVWEESRPAVVFVTHDIEEGVLIGDRVILLSGNPAKICCQWTVQTPRGLRSADHDEVVRLKREIIDALEDDKYRRSS